MTQKELQDSIRELAFKMNITGTPQCLEAAILLSLVGAITAGPSYVKLLSGFCEQATQESLKMLKSSDN